MKVANPPFVPLADDEHTRDAAAGLFNILCIGEPEFLVVYIYFSLI